MPAVPVQAAAVLAAGAQDRFQARLGRELRQGSEMGQQRGQTLYVCCAGTTEHG